MAFDTLTSLNAIVALLGWLGVLLSYTTVQSFKLRQWRSAASFFVGAMAVFTIFKAITAIPLITTVWGTDIFLKTLFIALITIGVQRMRETAELIGA